MQLAIINPAAGGGGTTKRWRRAVDELGDVGVEVQTALTASRRDAMRIAREWVEAGNRQLIAVGGDGTINEIVDGCMLAGQIQCAEVTVGVVPLGTGSDLARTIGLAKASTAEAAAVIARGHTTRADVMRLTWDGHGEMRHAINTVNVGLGGEVVRRNSAAVKRRLGGSASFALATVGSLALHRPWELSAEIDGVALTGFTHVTELIVANGRFMGGGMSTHPEALLDDGLLDVLVFGAAGRFRLLGKLPKLYTGAHVRDPIMATYRATRVRLTSAADVPMAIDGEGSNSPPVTIEIVPGAIRLITAT